MKMKPLSLETIARVTGGTYIGPEAEKSTLITGVRQDSRRVAPGELFLCIKGERADGHSFADQVFENGAACCLAEHELPDPKGPYIITDSTTEALKKLGAYYRSLFDIPVIGIVGSVGKTSAKEMTAAALSSKFNVLKTDANLNNEIGVPLTLLELREEHQAAVIEMGISDFGEMTRLSHMVRPDICIMTNIGYCHLEQLHDLNGVLKAKSEVFANMSKSGIAIMNGDDPLLAAYEPGIRKITYGVNKTNDFFADNINDSGIDGIDCRICNGSLSYGVHIPAFGSHMVLAALAAAAAADCLGLSHDDIASGLLGFAPVGGRANAADTGYITLINDCYNANPNSVRASLTSLGGLSGRKVAILGDMFELGCESDKLHREIGRFAHTAGTDLLICCGKSAEFYKDGFLAENPGGNVRYFTDKSELIPLLPELIKKGDRVLVKASHGMHFEELVNALSQLK